jgi:hypothetical protein
MELIFVITAFIVSLWSGTGMVVVVVACVTSPLYF